MLESVGGLPWISQSSIDGATNALYKFPLALKSTSLYPQLMPPQAGTTSRLGNEKSVCYKSAVRCQRQHSLSHIQHRPGQLPIVGTNYLQNSGRSTCIIPAQVWHAILCGQRRLQLMLFNASAAAEVSQAIVP